MYKILCYSCEETIFFNREDVKQNLEERIPWIRNDYVICNHCGEVQFVF
jgi:hypothetical protein